MALVIWRFLDGRLGHEKQSAGLCDAIADLCESRVYDFTVSHSLSAAVSLLRGSHSLANQSTPPALLIGAGRATHLPMLAARRRYGGRTLVLMKPVRLPLSWFDCCIIPEHDEINSRDNVIPSCGVLNNIVPAVATQRDATLGLVLIGGDSRHYLWDETQLQQQLQQLFSCDSAMRWQISDSPRTPVATRRLLADLDARGLCTYIDYSSSMHEPVEKILARASMVWVTEDSASMLYEALSAGVPTGLLSVPSRTEPANNKLHRQAQKLMERNMLMSLSHFCSAEEATEFSTSPLQEAVRVAEVLQQQGFLSDIH